MVAATGQRTSLRPLLLPRFAINQEGGGKAKPNESNRPGRKKVSEGRLADLCTEEEEEERDSKQKRGWEEEGEKEWLDKRPRLRT